MFLRVCVMVVLALVGLGQVAAIRRLVGRRDGGRQLAVLLLVGGAALLAAAFATRWTPGLSLPPWLGSIVAVASVTAMLCGGALLERRARTRG